LKRGQLSEIYTKKGQPGNTIWSETTLKYQLLTKIVYWAFSSACSFS